MIKPGRYPARTDVEVTPAGQVFLIVSSGRLGEEYRLELGTVINEEGEGIQRVLQYIEAKFPTVPGRDYVQERTHRHGLYYWKQFLGDDGAVLRGKLQDDFERRS